jgi:hypothetical protein
LTSISLIANRGDAISSRELAALLTRADEVIE